MRKPISRKMHGFADYPYAAAIAAAPELVGFEEETEAVTLCRALGAGVLLTSLLTRYELGIFRVLPFKLHLATDILAGVGALAAPFVCGFNENGRARDTFLTFGVLSLLVAFLTRAEEMN